MAKRIANEAGGARLSAGTAEDRFSVRSGRAAPAPAAASRNALLRRLVEDHHGALVSYLRRRLSCRADADDLAQEIYCRLSARRESGGIEDPRAYLSRAARNLLADRRRRERRRSARAHIPIEEAREGDLVCPAPSPERGAEARLKLEAVERALGDLAPNCRAAFLMVRFEERSYKDVAARLGVSVKTVEYYMREALTHIQRRVDAEAPARRRGRAE